MTWASVISAVIGALVDALKSVLGMLHPEKQEVINAPPVDKVSRSLMLTCLLIPGCSGITLVLQKYRPTQS